MFSKFYRIGIIFAVILGILNGPASSENCGKYPLLPGFSCCNGNEYLSQMEVCCDGQVADPKECCNGKICCQGIDVGTACCGGAPLPTSQYCCCDENGENCSPSRERCVFTTQSLSKKTSSQLLKQQQSSPDETPRKTVQSVIPNKKTTRG